MGKKKKKKFRAQLAQALEQMEKEKPIQEQKNISAAKTTGVPIETPVEKVEKSKDNLYYDEKSVIKDIKLIVFAMIVCITLLLGIFFINIRTHYIKNFSDYLTKSLNIKI